ncbi:MAG: ABC transporter permease subunit, partial [Gemmatimonadaceae bacterium]
MSGTAAAFVEATVRSATPLALAALGEVVVEAAGVINIGLEGVILAGAFGALVGAGHGGIAGGFAAAIASGVGVAAVFAVFAVWLRADQIISGTALTLLAVGLTGTLYRSLYGATGAALSIPTIGPWRIPGLASIPVVGSGFFNQPAVTYVVYLLAPAIWWWMYRTHAGLALRAVGESPA